MHNRPFNNDRGSRRGFTLIEVIAAAGIISVLFLSAIPLLGHVRTVRHEADRRAAAHQEAANVMERVAALAIRDELTAETLEALTLSPAADRLPSAELQVSLKTDDGPLSGRRVTVAVRWTPDVGAATPPATLTAWFPQQQVAN